MSTRLLSTTILSLLCFSLFAASDWTGAVSTDWNDSANWTNGVPSSTRVTIPDVSGASGNFPIVDAAVPNINSFTIDAGATLSVVTGGSLVATGTTVDGVILITGGSLTTNSTTINGSVSVSGGIFAPTPSNIGGTLTITGGSVLPTGATNVNNGGSLLISGGNLTTVNRPLVVDNGGTLVISGTGMIDIGDSNVNLRGSTTINGGSLITDTDKNINIGANGTFEMTAGSVATQNFVNNNDCTISGGSVICTLDFQMSGGMTNLELSGGTISCRDLDGGGSADVSGSSLIQISRNFALNPSDWNASGGTVQFTGAGTGGAFGSPNTYTFNNVIVDEDPNFGQNANSIISILGNLSLKTAVPIALPANQTHSAGTLTIDATGQADGEYGPTGSAADNTTDALASGSGFLNVSTSLLPINLLSMEAKLTSAGIKLNWTTSAERDNDYMAVEHSADAKFFREIGRVSGRGTTELEQNYSFLDVEPLVGLNYYRLRQVDYDGTTAYHQVISLEYQKAAVSLETKVFPNPAQDFLNVRWLGSSEQETQLQVLDISGRQLVQHALGPRQTSYQLPLNNLPGGSYLLRVQSGAQVELIRFQKY